jgi:hypothetical protein
MNTADANATVMPPAATVMSPAARALSWHMCWGWTVRSADAGFGQKCKPETTISFRNRKSLTMIYSWNTRVLGDFHRRSSEKDDQDGHIGSIHTIWYHRQFKNKDIELFE